MDSAKLFGYGWRPKVSLEEGIRIAYAEFRAKSAAGSGAPQPALRKVEE
jgi:nucleoside-diphosphate-sugar epimerase